MRGLITSLLPESLRFALPDAIRSALPDAIRSSVPEMIRSSLPQKVSAQLAASVAIVAGGAAYVPHTNEHGVPLAALRATIAAAVAPDEDNGAQAGSDRAAESSVPALPLKAGPGASPTTGPAWTRRRRSV